MALPLAQQQPESAHWFVDDDGRRHALSFNGFVWFMPPRPTCRGEFVASLDYLRRNLRRHPLRGGEASTFRTVPDRQDVLERLRAIEPQLRPLGMKELWLFGSVARGDADFDSDVDLAVLMDWDRAREGDYFDAWPVVTRVLRRQVDMVELPFKGRLARCAGKHLVQVF